MRSFRTCGVVAMAIGLLAVPATGLAASPAPASDDPGAIPAPSLRATCPNPYGGSCLGPLAAGTYRTTTFETPITYTVPDGWANYEDLPGTLLLVPPGSTLEGVDGGTSDYVGVAQGAAVQEAHCESRPEPGVGTTAAEMAAALAARDGLVVTVPVPVELSGLSGVMIDVTFRPGSADPCPVPGVPLLIGTGPAEFEHMQGDPFTTRLYLLDHDLTNFVVEASDVTASPGTFADYEPVIDAIVIGSE